MLQANGVLAAVTALLVGAAALRRYRAGTLSCKAAGLWALGLGAAAAADYAVSSWLWKRFPARK